MTPSRELEWLQYYVILINQLIKCPISEQLNILNAHSELLDGSLLTLMEAQIVVTMINGDTESAYHLKQAARHLANILELSLSSLSIFPLPQNPDYYVTFLIQLLEATEDSNKDVQVVYPLLQANLDKLDGTLTQSLVDWAANTLPKLELKEGQRIARSIRDLSDLIRDFPFGNRANNLEMAISGYKIALNIFTRETFPEDWAFIQISLGIAYFKRIFGDRAENIELMIAVNKNALEVCNRKTDPKNWAVIQTNLANAYVERIRGERAENMELAIAAYKAALEVRTRDAFPLDWALTQMNLGNTYKERIRGNRAENLEMAIAACQASLQVFTPKVAPQHWTLNQVHLASAYLQRVWGDRSENIELAISASQAALKICTQESLPDEWATLQDGLGCAYNERIRGEQAENIELAISAFQAALQVHTLERFPREWAKIQNNLGGAYWRRIRGERTENIELSIVAYKYALQVFSRETNPYTWAIIQSNLAVAYWNRSSGDRVKNIELSISLYIASLQVILPETDPYIWALIQNNLGNAYVDRIQGDQAENFELAITAYINALEVRTREAFPRDWAITQLNLGNAYSDRIQEDQAENLEQAIAAYKSTLQVFTREASPQEWATVQNNLGNGYIKRLRAERADNVDQAIAFYKAALQIHTYEAFPLKWAKTQNNLGNAYIERVYGNRAKNLELAIKASTSALKVYNRESFPQDWAMTHNNLGLAYSEQGKTTEAIAHFRLALEVNTPTANPVQCLKDGRNFGNTAFHAGLWTEAIEGYSIAVEAVEQMRDWVSSDTRKQELLSEAIDVYSGAVQAYINNQQFNKAIEYVERSKARNLIELLANIHLNPKPNLYTNKSDYQKVCSELEKLRRKIPAVQRRLSLLNKNQSLEGRNSLDDELRQSLNQLQQQRDELIKEISKIDPSFKYTQRVEPISFQQIQSFLDVNTAIIEWYITSNSLITFIITYDSLHPIIYQFPHEDLAQIWNNFKDYLLLYYEDSSNLWQTQLDNNLQKLASLIHIDDVLTSLPHNCDKLILIPHRFLHLYPLHALPISNKKLNSAFQSRIQNYSSTVLLDLFPKGVQYSPSCQLLQINDNQQRHDFFNLFAIQNPTDDLPFSEVEIEVVSSLFSSAQILKKQAATKSALYSNQGFLSSHCSHFLCHGYFDLTSPLDSALILANGERLTLGDIFELNLLGCRLVTLSACETGMTDPGSRSDEYIGLPSGFLYAGSPSVVSSLWKISDESAALLIIKFYQNLFQSFSVAVALNQAQIWLRDVTGTKLWEWVEEHKLPLSPTLKMRLRRIAPNDKPFQNPFYWAAFCAIDR
ncbi:CHAT domain-containing protein [Nostocales cyanobacterium LEGE 12452]|nr:CHAT domain-containing protein [Nostocales cyanobacterium LEGE 12452]